MSHILLYIQVYIIKHSGHQLIFLRATKLDSRSVRRSLKFNVHICIHINICTRTHGSFSKRVNSQQRRRVDASGEEVEEQLLAYVRVNPRVSTRHVGKELGISHNAICKI